MYSKYVYGSIIPFVNNIMLGYIQICLRITAFYVFKVSTAVSNAEVIYKTFLRAKQVGEKSGKFQNVVEIAHKAVILILVSLLRLSGWKLR